MASGSRTISVRIAINHVPLTQPQCDPHLSNTNSHLKCISKSTTNEMPCNQFAAACVFVSSTSVQIYLAQSTNALKIYVSAFKPQCVCLPHAALHRLNHLTTVTSFRRWIFILHFSRLGIFSPLSVQRANERA